MMQANNVELKEHLCAGFGWRYDGEPGICLMLPRDAFIEKDNGEPSPGVVMTAAQAREIAYVLLLHAEQLAGGSIALPRAPA
jgi:hypothetical protein